MTKRNVFSKLGELTLLVKLKNKTKKVKKIRHTEYYQMQDIFDELYASSKANKQFHNLLDIITSRNNILLAFRNIKANTGSKTKGTDGLTIKDIENLDIEKYITLIQDKFKNYKPQSVRRIEIPKANGKTRPLGIPTMIDRLIQQCILQVLEPICEAKFSENSYGFRPNRSTEHAIAKLYMKVQKHNKHYCVDVDIKGFFDNVNHSKLLKQIYSFGIVDKNLLCIISKILKSDIEFPNGDTISSAKGTPQGGIISPLLSNIVLNELDKWIESQWSDFPNLKEIKPSVNNKGTRNKSSEYTRMRKNTKLKEMHIIRYADDFKILCEDYKTAVKVNIAVKKWLNDRLTLEVSEEKSKITNLRKNYTEFLGFKIKVRSKNGKKVVKSHISDKAKKYITNKLIEQVKLIQKGGKDYHKHISKYNSMVVGMHNYYQLATNCNLDFGEVAFRINRTLFNRIKIKKRTTKEDKNHKNFILNRYGKSKQLRFFGDIPIAPIGYIQNKNPMNKKLEINKYTEVGRKTIHKLLDISSINPRVLESLIASNSNGSIQYSDNRISLYTGQNGKCVITQSSLQIGNIHCHHIKPRKLGIDDNYNNLILICSQVHKLIHATVSSTIDRYLKTLNLDKKQISKVNKYREILELEKV